MTEEKIGSYVIEGPIGRGGMGVVYKGRHAKLPRVVAIKSIDSHFRRDLRRLRSRFEREAFVQSQLDHPAIVKIHDYIVSEQTYHIVMEFVEGSSLAELLDGQAGKRLPVERALDIFEQILGAVAYAHSFVYRDEKGETRRGMIHRDLKPPNILVSPDDRVKITDFGIVKLAGATEADTSGLIYGSPHYVSPEQAQGRQVDQRSDIYSLGVILYEMLTGEVPFGRGPDGRNLKRSEVLNAHVEQKPRRPTEINPEIGRELERAVCRGLEKSPERRFDTAFDFWRAIRHARGRAAADIDEQETALDETERRERADTERIAGVTGELGRDSYTTQPMTSAFCDACGAEAVKGDARCRSCGLHLNASPATENLSRGIGKRRSRYVLLSLLLLAAAALGFAVYRIASREERTAGKSASDADPKIAVAPSADKMLAPAAAPAEVRQLRPDLAEVDSSYDGYDAKPLTDGVTDVRRIADLRYNKGNWVSAETTDPHFIELAFDGRPRAVTAVYVFWGFDRDRFMPSRRVELHRRGEDGSWVKVSEMEPGGNFDRGAFNFEPFEAARLRVYQPAQAGPQNRPFVMWVREVQVFGSDALAASR